MTEDAERERAGGLMRGDAWRVVGIGLALLYIATPLRIGDIYPFARFAMFSQHIQTDRRLVVEVEGPHVYPVEAFSAFDCRPVDERPPCFDDSDLSYNEKHDLAYVQREAIDDSDPLTGSVVLRVMRQQISFAEPYGEPQIDSCPLLECTGRRGAIDDL